MRAVAVLAWIHGRAAGTGVLRGPGLRGVIEAWNVERSVGEG